MAKSRKIIGLLFLALILVLTGGVLLVYFTPLGSKMAVDTLLPRYIPAEEHAYSRFEGTMNDGIVLENVLIDDPQWFKEGYALKIGKIFIRLDGFSPEQWTVIMDNARLVSPTTDPLVFTGGLKSGQWALDFFTRSFDSNLLRDFGKIKLPPHLRVRVREVDLQVSGPWQNPALKGVFEVEYVRYKKFSFEDADVTVDLVWNWRSGAPQATGVGVVHNGRVSGPKTAVVTLNSSRLRFAGPLDRPKMDVWGQAKVEATVIKVHLTGTPQDPDFALSSQPSYPEERLLLMLATNKSWQSAVEAIGSRDVSAALAKDFLDYFLFSGSGNKIAEYFGIKDVSVHFDETSRGVKVKKSMLDNFDAIYGIEQQTNGQGTTGTKQTVGGEYQLSDEVTIEGEKGIRQEPVDGQTTTEEWPPVEDQLMIKYKKKF